MKEMNLEQEFSTLNIIAIELSNIIFKEIDTYLSDNFDKFHLDLDLVYSSIIASISAVIIKFGMINNISMDEVLEDIDCAMQNARIINTN